MTWEGILFLKIVINSSLLLHSAFPACKFGDKCAYKHPKCKFGLSCTKLGCVFSHPTQQCKYHPFCTKPACPYSHPVASAPALEATSQRAKFTWRRRDWAYLWMYKPEYVILIGSRFWSMKDYFVQINNETSLSSISWHEVISIIAVELTSRFSLRRIRLKKKRKGSSVQLWFITSDCSFICS